MSYRLVSAHSHAVMRTLQREFGSLVDIKICASRAKIQYRWSHLCRQEEYYSTVKGGRGYSRWRPDLAAHSQGDRRSSAFLLLGKRPFQSSAYWWRLRQGFCTARTSQLKVSEILSRTRAWQNLCSLALTWQWLQQLLHWGWFIGLTDTLG